MHQEKKNQLRWQLIKSNLVSFFQRFTQRKKSRLKTDGECKQRKLEKKSLFFRLFHGKPCPICSRLLYGSEVKVRSHLTQHFCYDLKQNVIRTPGGLIWSSFVLSLVNDGCLQTEKDKGNTQSAVNEISAVKDREKTKLDEDSLTALNTIITPDQFSSTCLICNLRFYNKSALWVHKKDKHPTRKYVFVGGLRKRIHVKSTDCLKCGMKFSDHEAFKEHIKDKHTSIYTCDICQTQLANKDSLKKHKRLHERDELGGEEVRSNFLKYSKRTNFCVH